MYKSSENLPDEEELDSESLLTADIAKKAVNEPAEELDSESLFWGAYVYREDEDDE